MITTEKSLAMDNRTQRDKGFTLIELMAVVAIVSILAVIALPAYLDYVVRSKVSEGMGFVSEAKTSVSEYYYNTKRRPAGNQQAGLPPADEYDKEGGYVKRLEVSSTDPLGVITVTFKIPGSSADGKKLQLIPSTADAIMTWTCLPAETDGISVNQVPPNCRG